MRRGAAGRGALVLASTLSAPPAWAHGDLERLGPFYAGALHPLVVPGHALAVVSLGLLVGQRGLPAEARSLSALAAGLAGGLALAGAGPSIALPIALPIPLQTVALLLGALAALLAVASRPVPGRLLTVLAAAIGVGVGLDSAPAAAAGWPRWSALAGTALGGIAAASLVAGLVSTLCERGTGGVPRLGVRVLASWLAASALLTLALGSLGTRPERAAQDSGSTGAISAITRPQDQ